VVEVPNGFVCPSVVDARPWYPKRGAEGTDTFHLLQTSYRESKYYSYWDHSEWRSKLHVGHTTNPEWDYNVFVRCCRALNVDKDSWKLDKMDVGISGADLDLLASEELAVDIPVGYQCPSVVDGANILGAPDHSDQLTFFTRQEVPRTLDPNNDGSDPFIRLYVKLVPAPASDGETCSPPPKPILPYLHFTCSKLPTYQAKVADAEERECTRPTIDMRYPMYDKDGWDYWLGFDPKVLGRDETRAIPDGYTCPTIVNSLNWQNNDLSRDRFLVTQVKIEQEIEWRNEAGNRGRQIKVSAPGYNHIRVRQTADSLGSALASPVTFGETYLNFECCKMDCVEVKVGPGAAAKAVSVPAGYTCPATVNRLNWKGATHVEQRKFPCEEGEEEGCNHHDYYPDTFHLTNLDDNQVMVTRTDGPESWDTDFSINCCVPPVQCVRIGVGPSAQKFFTHQVPEGYQCPLSVHQDNWNGGYRNDHTFTVKQEGTEITVMPDQCGSSWDFNLEFECCIPTHAIRTGYSLPFAY